MAAAAAQGLNVMRTWAHSSDEAFPFQVCVRRGSESRGTAVERSGTAGMPCPARRV